MASSDQPPEKEFNPRSGCLGQAVILILVATGLVFVWFVISIIAMVAGGGFGDPYSTVSVRNDSQQDYILAWVEARTEADDEFGTYADSVFVPVGAEGLAYGSSIDQFEDLTFLILTPTCDIVSALRASGDDIRLLMEPEGVLDRTEAEMSGAQLELSTDCIATP